MKLDINDKLWDAIIGLLQELPAKTVRAVLNAIEQPSLCKKIEEVVPEIAQPSTNLSESEEK